MAASCSYVGLNDDDTSNLCDNLDHNSTLFDICVESTTIHIEDEQRPIFYRFEVRFRCLLANINEDAFPNLCDIDPIQYSIYHLQKALNLFKCHDSEEQEQPISTIQTHSYFAEGGKITHQYIETLIQKKNAEYNSQRIEELVALNQFQEVD